MTTQLQMQLKARNNAPSQLGDFWYKGNAFDKAELVTADSANPALGLDRIVLSQLKTPVPGIVCRAKVSLNGGMMTTWVDVRNKNNGALWIAVPQRSYVDRATQEVKYVSTLSLHPAIKAQVSRYVETLVQQPVAPQPVPQPIPTPVAPSSNVVPLPVSDYHPASVMSPEPKGDVDPFVGSVYDTSVITDDDLPF